MTSSDENQDLQEYLDNFKSGIEESDDCVTITAEALRAFSEADAVTEKILEEDAGLMPDDDLLLKKSDDKESIYYVNLSDKEPIQVKLVEESIYKTPSQSIPNKGKASERKINLRTCVADENDEKEKIYEFDENDPELTVNGFDENKKVPIVTGGTVMHAVPKTEFVSVDSSLHFLQCALCPYRAKKRFLLLRHMHTHSEERPYKCSVCDRGFKTNPALVNHMNAHLGKKPHGCTYCEKRFNTSGDLMRHTRYKHTGEKPHKCGECDYSCVELTKMRRHMRCHTGERPYQCPHCTYASPDTFKLKRHLRTHTGEKPYECDICLARFTQSNTLKAHRLIHTAVDRPVFQCELCPTTCGRKTDLQMHIQKLHNTEHPVKCKRCGKKLQDRYSYKVHIKTHEGEKCYRCPVCPYASIKERHLEIHMRIHTDEKPFVCEKCGSSFRQNQLLQRHINIHHNSEYIPPAPSEKSHVCPDCDKAFTRKGNLMRHMESHDSQVDIKEEKLKLRIGRQIRIQTDGSIAIPPAGEAENFVISNTDSNFRDSVGISDDGGDFNEYDGNDDDDDEEMAQGEESFSILEIEDEENIGNIAGTVGQVSYRTSIKSNDTISMLKPMKIESQSSFKNKIIVLPPSQNDKRKPVNRLKVKSERASDPLNIDDESEHIMVIEVVDDDDAGDENAMKIENSVNQKNILDLPIASGDKNNLINKKSRDCILPIDCKPSHITIMDLVIDEE